MRIAQFHPTVKTIMFEVNFNHILGKIKPLHGVCNSPVQFGTAIPSFIEAGIPFSRLHDTGGPYGHNRFVDIPNIFRNFDADPEDPDSYDFAFTDAYLKGLNASGTDIIYRLGVTIENEYGIKVLRINPPADFHKWAVICEHIISHYNEGWANGLHLGIKYWEIWNEPENPAMWTGTREQYFELYRITANYLKQRFPEIKVGGYAGCGFYTVTRKVYPEWYLTFVEWFEAFLKFVTAPETKSPLDFYSWHLYTNDPEEIAAHAHYVRQNLDNAGLTDTENIFNEWNRIDDSEDQFDRMKELPGALFTAATFCSMQNSSIDIACYYDATPTRAFGGLYYFPSKKVTKTWHSFKAFNELYKLGLQAEITHDISGLYALAATDGNGRHAMMMVNETEAQLTIPHNPAKCNFREALVLDDKHLLAQAPECLADGSFIIPKRSVVLLTD